MNEQPKDVGPILLKGVLLYGEGERVDIRIADGLITEIGPDLAVNNEHVLDRTDQIALPGLVDIHTHLREPGREDTETIASGSLAAARGGFTAVFAMANTTPVADNQTITDSVYRIGQDVGHCDVHPVGAVTIDLQGKQLAEMGQMASGEGQVKIFSDDGKCVYDPLLMRRALEYSVSLDVLIAQHAEEPRLTVGSVAHEGPTAARLGLGGWPRSAEESIVARDAILARDAGARVHICHASTAGTVELLRWAKDQGVNITAEVTPHHLLLDDSCLETYDGVYRVNPPLRESSDAHALQDALLEGIVDCVATDHAPHASQEKCCEFAHARPGMLGLETSLPVISEIFVETGRADWRWVAEVMSEKPARIARLDDQGRPLAVGEPANIAVIHPNAPWEVVPQDLASLSENTPYRGMTFNAAITATLLRGVLTHERDTATDGAA